MFCRSTARFIAACRVSMKRSLTSIAWPLARFRRLSSESVRKRLQAASIASSSALTHAIASARMTGSDVRTRTPVPSAVKSAAKAKIYRN